MQISILFYLWIIGDGQGFVGDAHAVLQHMEGQQAKENGFNLYLHERYKIMGFMCPPSSMNSNPMTRISNVLIKGINSEQSRMPKHIIVLLDQNLIEYGHEYADRLMGMVLE